MTWIRKWNQLDGGDRVLLVQASVIVVLVRCCLLIFRYGQVEAFATRDASLRRRNVPESTDRMQARNRIVWAINTVTRRLQSERSCLTRALAARWMLGRAGIHVEICIGAIRRGAGEIEAHAWVEQDGEVILGGRRSPTIYQKFVRRS